MEVLKRFGKEESNTVHNPLVPYFRICKDKDGVEVDDTSSNKW